MLAQHTSPHTLDPSAKGSFWVTALLGLPAANVALLGFAGFLASDVFFPLAALVAVGELALLIPWTRTYGIGVVGALAAMLGIVLITVLGLVVVALVALSIACSGASECF